MLPIGELFPHPNNPRKQLGDLTELAASIKKNGIMQNLTVVPRELGGYTLVIGHRRCQAARQAGLTELPCVITELTKREQISIMLCENMQRADISPYEQAESMQLMLDLGDTVNDIAEKTGFTKKTVKDRLRLTKLDREKLKKACQRQVSLTDLLKISDITDEKMRNEVLAKAGTNNFATAYTAAKDAQEKKRKMDLMRETFNVCLSEKSRRDVRRRLPLVYQLPRW